MNEEMTNSPNPNDQFLGVADATNYYKKYAKKRVFWYKNGLF